MNKNKLIILSIVLVCLLYGQEKSSEIVPLQITLTLVRQQYKIRESWEYEIRIDNITNDTVRIPQYIEGHYFPKMIKSDGQEIMWAYVILAADYYDQTNTIKLAPNCFFGEKCSWTGPGQADTYVFYVQYLAPQNLNDHLGDSLLYYWEGPLESNKVNIIVK